MDNSIRYTMIVSDRASAPMAAAWRKMVSVELSRKDPWDDTTQNKMWVVQLAMRNFVITTGLRQALDKLMKAVYG